MVEKLHVVCVVDVVVSVPTLPMDGNDPVELLCDENATEQLVPGGDDAVAVNVVGFPTGNDVGLATSVIDAGGANSYQVTVVDCGWLKVASAGLVSVVGPRAVGDPLPAPSPDTCPWNTWAKQVTTSPVGGAGTPDGQETTLAPEVA